MSLTLVMVFFTPLIAFWPLFECWRFFGVLPVPFSVIGLIFFTFEIQLSETTMPRCAQIEGGGTRGTFLLGNALSKISSWIAARNKVISAVITLMLQSFVCQILHHRPKMAGAVEQGHFLTPNAYLGAAGSGRLYLGVRKFLFCCLRNVGYYQYFARKIRQIFIETTILY